MYGRRSSLDFSSSYRLPSYDRYGTSSTGRSYGSYYDMGTGKNYTPSSSYGASSRAYTPSSSRPSYTRTASYDPPKYRSASSVSDTIKKFGASDPKYSSTGYAADRYQSSADKYPSLDRYSSRSGYMSDYGGGSPYGSWDRASTRSSNSRYGGGSREASPVSTRSSRYDYSSSASGPYSTYSSYKSGSDASPVPKPPARSYERQSSRGYEAPANDTKASVSGGGSTGAARVPGLPVGRQEASSKRGRRGVSVSSESDDSAPEAEKRDQTVRYLICRGTSPIPEGEPKEPKVKDKASISRTRRIKVPDKSPIRIDKLGSKKGNTEKGTVDCATQTNLDQPQARRQRTSSNSSFAPSGGAGGGGSGSTSQPGETFYKYRDKVLGGPAPTHGYGKGSGPSTPSYSKTPSTPASRNSSRSTLKDEPRRSYADEGVSTPPNERSWRQSVYGEPAPRGSTRREEDMEEEDENDTDDRSSRHGRRRREGPRTSTPSTLRDREQDHGSATDDKRSSRKSKASRSSSREDMLDDRPRRKRHSSKELLDEREPEGGDKPPLTPETLSLRDSIEKVHQWKQNLPPPEPLSPESRHVKRHPGVGAESRGEVYEELPSRARVPRQYSNREESPPLPRDDSPSRKTRHKASRHASRQNSHDSILDEDEDDDREQRLPNKDFRKSELNKAEHFYEDPEAFERELSPGEARRRQRRSDGFDHPGGQKMKKSGSSSEAFSKEDSPSRHRHSGIQRPVADDHKRLIRDNSRDSLLDERRRSRREQHDNDISDSNGSQFGFNREESPNRRNSKYNRHSRQNSREDVLDERGQNSARQRPNQLGVNADGGRVPQSVSNQSLPDIVPSPDNEWVGSPDQPKQSKQYKGQRSGMIGEVDDIDSVLNGNRKSFKGGYNIMDEPVPHTSHYPLKPAPASPLSPGQDTDRKARPNSYAFERDKRQGGNNMKQSKSHGDKLIDIDDDNVEAQRSGQLSAPPASGQRAPRQPSATAKQMWGILQSKKGLVTITDFVSLCEKPAPQRKLITVPGADENDFAGYKSADELLENMGVDVRKLEDCALQIYRYHSGSQADFGTYLDLESTLAEQADELEGFSDQRKNTLILRTQLTVRVHAIIEKLLNSTGRELRRALFSLKQIFQDDKDLVHEFVNNDGLDCLIKVGTEADQNYQNYILRALGQVMLYVDGMEGVIRHNATVQWLYSLLASKGRLVVKTALKLLLVFVEYTESNTTQLVKAINSVDSRRGLHPWTNIMSILNEKDGADSELLVYAMTLVNKVISAIPDQDTFYDVTDALEELGMDAVTQRHMHKQGADLDLLTQFQIYESALKHEDGEDFSVISLVDNLRRVPRQKSEGQPRKSKRHDGGKKMSKAQSTSSIPQMVAGAETPAEAFRRRRQQQKEESSVPPLDEVVDTYGQKGRKPAPGEWAPPDTQGNTTTTSPQNNLNFQGKGPPYNESGYHSFAEAQLDPNAMETRNNAINDERSDSVQSNNQRWQNYKQGHNGDVKSPLSPVAKTVENGFPGSGEGQVKGMLNKLKGEDLKLPKEAMRPAGDSSGLISAAKDGLTRQIAQKVTPAPEPEKKTESDLQWDRIQRRLKRQLMIKDMDFTDLKDEDDEDVFYTPKMFGDNGFGPPPPPPGGMPPPPPMMGGLPPPPPPPGGLPPPPPPPGGRGPPPPPSPNTSALPPPPGANLKKNKKTVRLHWRALAVEPHAALKGEVIWKQLVPITIDTDKLEHLFETRTSELKAKKQDATGKKEITVLDPKRSNAINIGLTVLPPPRAIKAAILKMDNSIMNKEGIEKILNTMIPTEEEKSKILEAQMANPDIPLGTAEQFLLTLSSIFELEARLKLWLFKLDYELLEQEIAEPLMDLKKGISELQKNKTFRCILSGILAMGNFLNGAAIHAFSVEFLQRVPEIKDTVHKHSLLHHLCSLIIEQFPDSTDLYSEIGPITRCSRIDWDELSRKLDKMEYDCKASWDHLRAIVKHDGSSTDLKGKMSLFLADAAERIMILHIINKRILNRYNKLLLYLGFAVHDAREMKINTFCKVISEFALEYRTTRDKVLQMLQKKANQRERKKTRGKMIVDTENFKNKDAHNDDALSAILKNGYTSADERGLPGQRSRRKLDARSMGSRGGMTTDSDMYDTGDDEILEACVRTATAPTSRPQRERKRSRSQRKSLRRTLKGGLDPEAMMVVGSFADQV
ncbi:uncharacterized protein LOC131935409 isoform X6 [Physella acuta]|uniref:uncharacterized protein LOC131935409 isoform X6 n=1 Tax=Physella acuta TaxID=109671 RepID=UPI0027DB9F8A|nr:uncharacterized protein LOC131935409 isoform X6 [Physella acuta]